MRRVADDPALLAELMLLFRMILADGEVRDRELETFRRICAESFGIGPDSFGEVMTYLQDFGYEITSAQAIAVFRDLDKDRRTQLARHMAEIAKADTELSKHEVRLLARVIDMLDLKPADVVTPEN